MILVINLDHQYFFCLIAVQTALSSGFLFDFNLDNRCQN